MKEKILAQLVAKHPGVSKHALGLYANKLAGKVTAEDQIEGAITELEAVFSVADFAAALQSEGDRRVSEAKPKLPKTEDKPKPEDKPVQDEDKTLEGKIAAMFSKLESRLDTMEKSQTKQSVAEKFAAALKAKKLEIHPSFLKGRTPATEDELEAALTEVETDWNEFQQGQANAGMAANTPPGSASASSTAVDAAIDRFVGTGKTTESK